MTLGINLMNIIRRNSAALSPISLLIDKLKNDPKQFYKDKEESIK